MVADASELTSRRPTRLRRLVVVVLGCACGVFAAIVLTTLFSGSAGAAAPPSPNGAVGGIPTTVAPVTQPVVNDAANAANPVIQPVQPVVNDLSTTTAPVVQPVTNDLAPLTSPTAGAVNGALGQVATGLGGALPSPLGTLGAGQLAGSRLLPAPAPAPAGLPPTVVGPQVGWPGPVGQARNLSSPAHSLSGANAAADGRGGPAATGTAGAGGSGGPPAPGRPTPLSPLIPNGTSDVSSGTHGSNLPVNLPPAALLLPGLLGLGLVLRRRRGLPLVVLPRFVPPG